MGGLGAFFAIVLAMADKRFRVEEDPLLKEVIAILPGTNCGACGYPGCHGLAEKIIKGEVPINTCVAGGQDVVDNLARVLGIESLKARRVTAVVLCRGGERETLKNAFYRGEKTCVAANLTNGEKACIYSCLGYGDCVRACMYSAMVMNDNGLPQVFYDACVGCGACAKACPRDIIEMHPVEHKLFNYCRNKDKGAVARKVCQVSCIACGLCVKDCPVEGGIGIKDNLAVINYERCPQTDEPTRRCPTKCILFGEEERMTKEAYYKSLKVAV